MLQFFQEQGLQASPRLFHCTLLHDSSSSSINNELRIKTNTLSTTRHVGGHLKINYKPRSTSNSCCTTKGSQHNTRPVQSPGFASTSSSSTDKRPLGAATKGYKPFTKHSSSQLTNPTKSARGFGQAAQATGTGSKRTAVQEEAEDGLSLCTGLSAGGLPGDPYDLVVAPKASLPDQFYTVSMTGVVQVCGI